MERQLDAGFPGRGQDRLDEVGVVSPHLVGGVLAAEALLHGGQAVWGGRLFAAVEANPLQADLLQEEEVVVAGIPGDDVGEANGEAAMVGVHLISHMGQIN